MGGDYSRVTFQPNKHFASVLLQQGRLLVDSDWNEAEAIRRHRERTLIRDILGPAAFAGDGFAISARGSTLTIRAGHAWVDGLVCELAADTDVAAQPDLPGAQPPTDSGTHVAYPEVWEREVTAIDDPSLRPVALDGPDTSTRLAVVAQVRFDQVVGHPRRNECWSPPEDETDTTLAVLGHYAGLENQLYRIEMHRGGDRRAGDQPTFKWSRDNGSTCAALRSWTPTVLELPRSHPSFAPGDRLEVIDRATILEHRPGVFVIVESTGDDHLIVSPADHPIPDRLIDPLVRRWDGGPTPIQSDGDPAIALDSGLEVRFAGSTYRTGDYWLVSAHAADATVEWPDMTPATSPHPPHGLVTSRVPLALVHRDGGSWTVLRDLRRLIADHESSGPPSTDSSR